MAFGEAGFGLQPFGRLNDHVYTENDEIPGTLQVLEQKTFTSKLSRIFNAKLCWSMSSGPVFPCGGVKA
jgi:hypothetical protein